MVGRRDPARVFRLDGKALAQRRHGGAHHALGEGLVIDVGDIVDLDAFLALGGVEILAAQLQAEHVAAVFVGFGEFARLLEAREVLRVGKLLQVAADYGLRLVVLGDGDGLEAVAALADVGVAAQEIDEVRALQQQLRHPGVVIVFARDVAIRAGSVSLVRTVCG